MKRIIALLLVCIMVMSSCAKTTPNIEGTTVESINDIEESNYDEEEKVVAETLNNVSTTLSEYQEVIPEFTNISDEDLHRYVQDNIYTELINELDSEDYYIENVSAVYVSKEYLEEIAYNSQSNIFFGYTLDELDTEFQGTRYIFNLSDDGETVVQAFESYDDTCDRIIEDVAIGTGVILISVTVSIVTGGVGGPAAISMIFAASAKSGAVFGLSSGALSGVAAGIITGIQTGDFKQALKEGALAGSEGFKWGAISGAILGGASELIGLRGATLNGLTMNEAAIIQKESKYPLDIIKQMKSMKEYEIYRNAGLVPKMINGKLALVREIDLTYKSDLAGKMITNLERMKKGYAPIDARTGKPYQLHHVNQKIDGTLAILNGLEHQPNATILDTIGNPSVINRYEFAKIRKAFWKSYAKGFGGI